MLWRSFSEAGVRRLVKMDGRMNAAKHREVHEETVLQSVQDLRPG